MANYTEQIQPIVGRRVIRAEWTGGLPIDDGEGYLLTFDDGTQILFSWYQAYDCIGVIHDLRQTQQATPE